MAKPFKSHRKYREPPLEERTIDKWLFELRAEFRKNPLAAKKEILRMALAYSLLGRFELAARAYALAGNEASVERIIEKIRRRPAKEPTEKSFNEAKIRAAAAYGFRRCDVLELDEIEKYVQKHTERAYPIAEELRKLFVKKGDPDQVIATGEIFATLAAANPKKEKLWDETRYVAESIVRHLGRGRITDIAKKAVVETCREKKYFRFLKFVEKVKK